MSFNAVIKYLFKLTSFHPKNNNPLQPLLQITEVIKSSNWQNQFDAREVCEVHRVFQALKTQQIIQFSTEIMYSPSTNISCDIVLDISHFNATSHSVRRRSALMTSRTLSHLLGEACEDGLHAKQILQTTRSAHSWIIRRISKFLNYN